MIFIYHYLHLMDQPGYSLDFIAITSFMFLSGFFSRNKSGSWFVWLASRSLKILVPYWLTMSSVCLINLIIGYKYVNTASLIISFAIGNLFTPNSLYVISWFITYILIYYVFVTLINSTRSYAIKGALLIALILGNTALGLPYLYPIAFISGYGCGQNYWRKLDAVKPSDSQRLLFKLQSYSYYFFLLHGGILLFLTHVLKASPLGTFVISFLLTLLLSPVLKETSAIIESAMFGFLMRVSSRGRQPTVHPR